MKTMTKTTKAKSKSKKAKEHLVFLLETVGFDHSTWIKTHPRATLFELLEYLEGVRDELNEFNDDDILAEIINELGDAGEYLRGFSPVDEPIVSGDDKLADVGYRLENVEEDIRYVEELIEEVGETFLVKRLPKRNFKVKAA